MTQPLISVIIPIYNVEAYLQRCLESVAKQDYQNLEVILVDDGSMDDSGIIADQFAKHDQRFKVIHQENTGLSAARNRGLDVMHGEYVTFIDSDDYVTPDYVSFMYQLLADTNFKAPLALCSLMNVYPATGRQQNCGDGSQAVLSGKECIEKMCYHDLVDTCAYAKLGKAELYQTVRFPEGKLFEDIATSYQLFMQAEQVACGFSPKYFYVIRDNSIVTAGFKPNKLDLLVMTDQMAREVVAYYPDLAPAVLRRQVYARFSTLNQTLHAADVAQVQAELVVYLRTHKKAVLKNPKTPRRDHLAYLMLSFGLPFYRWAWDFYAKRKGN
ncbi:glycosyltransferase family 2 protein [Limosilactobacillus ingluviei]|uniref:glycosyltransferase family 2 protein n=1 Tax=Limosilactobacillus ingluviei TaxID=148604 RepID=UPI0024BB10C7|nr:glycosyltransferase family 2 protein [Limosilactobacillus ingluviei]